MPKASPLQPSFSAGEFSPRLYGRTDSERYKTGLATCLNYMPTIEGPIIRRPGTKYSGFDVKDPSSPPVLIPYEKTAAESYILEFGDGYIRFFKNSGQVVTINSSVAYAPSDRAAGAQVLPTITATATQTFSAYSIDGNVAATGGSSAPIGSAFEMGSPFNSSDIRNLNFSQQGSDLYLTSGRLPPYKLTSLNSYRWAMTILQPLLDGPYLPFNTDQQAGDRAEVGLHVSIQSQPAGYKLPINIVETRPKTQVSVKSGNGPVIALSTASAHGLFIGMPIVVEAVGNSTNISWGTPPAGKNAGTGIVTGVANANEVTITMGDTVSHFGLIVGNSTYISPAIVQYDAGGRQLSMSVAGKRYWGVADIPGSSAHEFTLTTYENFFSGSANITTWQMGAYYYDPPIPAVANPGNFPRYNTFHQNRWVLSGYDRRAQEIVASITGEFNDFRTSNSSYVTADNNALQFNLVSKQPSAVQWLASDSNGLLAGGYSSEYKISPSANANALVPSNINATETSYFGSANVPAIKAANAVLYVQKSNRKVRELNYFFQVNTYRSTDLTELSDHISAPKITALANQNETIPAVWGLRSDGQLISMVYSRDDETLKAGWARHQLGGQSDSGGTAPKVLSMAVISGSSAAFDSLWMCTQRFINGTSVVNVEYLTKPFESGATSPEDAIQLDCAGTYDSPKAISGVTIAGSAIVSAAAHGFVDGDQVQITKVVGMNTSVADINGVIFNSNLVNYNVYRVGSTSTNAFFLQDVNNGSSYIDSRGYSVYVSGGEARKLVSNISGLTWLKNETVAILADGRIHPNTQVNSAGVLALSFSAAKVQVGLPYNSDAKTLRLDAGAADGSAIGKMRRPAKAAFQLNSVGEMSVGPTFEKMTPLSDVESFRADNSFADEAPPLFSGIARESLESEYDFDGQICIRQSAPLPGMIQSITTIIDESDI